MDVMGYFFFAAVFPLADVLALGATVVFGLALAAGFALAGALALGLAAVPGLALGFAFVLDFGSWILDRLLPLDFGLWILDPPLLHR